MLTETGSLILTNQSTGYSQARDCCRKGLASLGSGQWTQAGRPPHLRTDRRFSEKAVLLIQVPSGHPGTWAQVPNGHPGTSARISSGHPGTSAEVPSGHPDIPTQEPNGHPDTSALVPAGHPGIHTSTQWPCKDTNTYCNNAIDFFVIESSSSSWPLVSLPTMATGYLCWYPWMTTGYLCWCSWMATGYL